MSNEDITFTRGPARRPMPLIVDPMLQWSTGLPTSDRRIYAGWLCPTGQSEALDRALEHADFQQITIKHGGGNFVTHWAIECASMFVIADGVQTLTEMKHTPTRYGIAYGWRRQADSRPQSQLRMRVFLHELLAVGYEHPLLVTAKSTLTSDLINALLRQYEVLDIIDDLRKQQGKPALNPPLYACSIPIGPGTEVSRGSVQTRDIIPPIAVIPTPITRDYILAHWPKRSWIQAIESQIEATITWSMRESAAIADGTDRLGEE